MTDREKVIKELECCVSLNPNGAKCANCDYADEFHNGDCETYLLQDALALLKAQEPVIRCRDCKHWWEANELCTHQRHVHGTICTHECKAMDYCSDGERRDDDV